jgi:hypothetical protein
MRRFGVVSALVIIAAMVALAQGVREGNGADRDGSGTAPAEEARAEPGPPPVDPGEPVWIAIDFVELEAGGGSEYFGQVDRASLEAMLGGQLRGFLRLDQVFWLYDDGEVERLDDDIAYGETAYFRVDAIRRITPVKDGFPEAAREIPPGNRIVPSAGRDA